MRLILVRHPRPDIAPGRCYGRLDVPLHREGEAALPALRDALRATGIGRVFTSPARRCRQLAAMLVDVPLVDDRLQELDFGGWEGLAWDDVGRPALDRWAADPDGFAPPGGESGAALRRRVAAFCQERRAEGRDAIVVTHGGPLRLLPALLRGDPPDLLAPAPPFGAILTVHATHAMALSPAHSAATAQPPSTSPVKPPI